MWVSKLWINDILIEVIEHKPVAGMSSRDMAFARLYNVIGQVVMEGKSVKRIDDYSAQSRYDNGQSFYMYIFNKDGSHDV